MISGIILAGGESKRFGSLKQLYRIDDKSFLEMILTNLDSISLISEIIIGLGYKYKSILETINIKSPKLKIAINPDYTRGQLSTLQECIKITSPYARGYMVTLVDHPFVRKQTYSKIINEFINYGMRDIIIPVYNNRRGHPVIFPASLKDEILNAPLDIGARYVIKKFDSIVRLINMIDEFILADIDRIDDLEKIFFKARYI